MKLLIAAIMMVSSLAMAGTEVIYSEGPDRLIWSVDAKLVVKNGSVQVQVSKDSSNCRNGARCHFQLSPFTLDGLNWDKDANVVSFKGTECGFVEDTVVTDGRFGKRMKAVVNTGNCMFETIEENDIHTVILNY